MRLGPREPVMLEVRPVRFSPRVDRAALREANGADTAAERRNLIVQAAGIAAAFAAVLFALFS